MKGMIIMWTKSELKGSAKEILRSAYWPCVLVSFIFAIVSGGGGGAGYSRVNKEDVRQLRYINRELLMMLLIVVGVVAILSLLLAIFVMQPLQVGCIRYFIRVKTGYGMLEDVTFAFKENYMNVVSIMFIRGLKVFLWSLLFIIPGIIAAYKYMMVPYILADDPNVDIDKVFEISTQMMEGQKLEAFFLGFSFIGWFILSLFTMGLLNIFYVNPYVNLTFAELYDTLRTNYFEKTQMQ